MKKIIPIAFVIVLFVCIMIFNVSNDKKIYKEDYNQKLEGIISEILPGGKGSYKVTVTSWNGSIAVVYLSGLGEERDDILVKDSIYKEGNSDQYYFFRKKRGHFDLVYKRGIY